MPVLSMLSRLLCGASLLLPLTALSASIEVHVSGVSAKGSVRAAVCDQAHFLKQCAYSASAPAQAGTTTVIVNDVPAGRWAVLAYQDLNDNGELDRNFVGMPKEAYGFSRDARGKFGPPAFEDAAIEVGSANIVSSIKLR